MNHHLDRRHTYLSKILSTYKALLNIDHTVLRELLPSTRKLIIVDEVHTIVRGIPTSIRFCIEASSRRLCIVEYRSVKHINPTELDNLITEVYGKLPTAILRKKSRRLWALLKRALKELGGVESQISMYPIES